jgi:pimeloyl-ACP methyl ester carboxylesterase
VDRLEDEWLAGLVGRATGEPPRGPVGAEPVQGAQGHDPQLFDYYLGYLKDPSITHHFQLIANSTVEFAKQWGMNVAVQDLHVVIGAAKKLGGKVVLGGHSLGGSVVTAYATWDFNGHAGADDLAGLVYIDGGSSATPVSAQTATQTLQALDAPSVSPWLAFGGIAAPYAGLFEATGAASALLGPERASLGQTSGLLPGGHRASGPVTNLGQYGYALNASTSPSSLLAAQATSARDCRLARAGPRLERGRSAHPDRPLRHDVLGLGDPERRRHRVVLPPTLTDDTGAVDNGNANPAQSVLDVDATMGHSLPKNLLIYAFGARLGGASCPRTHRSWPNSRASP